MPNPLIKRTRAKRALAEARGAVGRLIDAAEALEPSRARGEVTSRGKWLLTAIGKLECELMAEALGEEEEARRRAAIDSGRPAARRRMAEAARIGSEGVESEEERIMAEGPAEEMPIPFPHHGEHGS